MGKYTPKTVTRSGPPVLFWVLAGVALLIIGAGMGYLIIKSMAGPQEALPAAANNLPTLPAPDLPDAHALPKAVEAPPLPDMHSLPEGDERQAELPETQALPEAKPAVQPQGPTGIVYWAATVQPFRSNMPLVQPKTGMQFVTSLFRVVNKSTAVISVDHNITAIQFNNQVYYPYVWASGMDAMANRRFLSPVDLQPNSMTEGYVAFEIPAGAKNVAPALSPQGLPATVQVRRVAMDKLPSPNGPAPTQQMQ